MFCSIVVVFCIGIVVGICWGWWVVFESRFLVDIRLFLRVFLVVSIDRD